MFWSITHGCEFDFQKYFILQGLHKLNPKRPVFTKVFESSIAFTFFEIYEFIVYINIIKMTWPFVIK